MWITICLIFSLWYYVRVINKKYMIIIITILALLLGFFIYKTEVSYDTGWILGIFITGFFLLISIIGIFRLNLSHTTLTGYIYSADDTYGYTTYHIRFSNNAGEDKQPSFCIPTDTAVAKELTSLVGSDTRVRVEIPPYFYITNNFFRCGTEKTTFEVIKKN